MKSQQGLMQEQQKASVWPFLEEEVDYAYSKDLCKIQFHIVNEGVGPALIQNMELYINKTKITKYDEISKILDDVLPADLSLSLSFSDNVFVLSPDEDFQILTLECPRFEGDQDIFNALEFGYNFCYCSIYKECWALNEQSFDNNRKPCQ